MSTKKKIEQQKQKIFSIVNIFIDEYTSLCESEIEKLFITNLFYYFFLGKYSVDRNFDNNDLIVFSGFNKIIIDEFDEDYGKFNVKVRLDNKFGNFKYKNIGIIFFEEHDQIALLDNKKTLLRNEYSFMPQYLIKINESNYRLDIGLIYIEKINNEIVKEKKIAIECDGFEYHSTKESITKDSIRARNLLSEGWNVIRYSGTEIFNTNNISEINNVMRQIKKIVSN